MSMLSGSEVKMSLLEQRQTEKTSWRRQLLVHLGKQLGFVSSEEEKQRSRLGREGNGRRKRGEPREFLSGRRSPISESFVF